ncbi:MAG: type I methionyl aminopeptidase [Candidatus Hydrogenedentes bacterium]|nr:type I methionyl aminopeptidase [Candidatus Hydrogenedentota bacterium]
MISVRSEREIDLLREANQIVAQVHDALQAMIAPGATTAELDAVAEDIILTAGAKPAFKGYHGFPASTCISVDEVIVHGIPGDRVLQEGEIVSVDVGVAHRGYYGDAAVSWACGTVDSARQDLLDTTDLALSEAIKAAAAGNYLQDIGRAVEAVCLPKGYGIVRDFVGHGIGTSMHEEPQIPNYDDGRKGPRLKAGMVLAIEPMVNMGTEKVRVLGDGWTAVTTDGKPSAHFEHSVVVREDGGEILSGSKVHVWGRRKAS